MQLIRCLLKSLAPTFCWLASTHTLILHTAHKTLAVKNLTHSLYTPHSVLTCPVAVNISGCLGNGPAWDARSTVAAVPLCITALSPFHS